MSYSNRLRAVALATLFVSASASAQWAGKGELGLVLARGNSDATTLNGKVDMKDVDGEWTYLAGASLLRASTSGTTSADRYELHGQANRALTPRAYLFGSGNFQDDKFSSFSYQASLVGGVGYKFIDTEPTKFAAELGIGYRRLKHITTGETRGDAVVHGALNFDHQLSASTKLFDHLMVEAGSANVYATNDAGVAVKMSDKLALSVAYQVRHNSKVDTDTIKKTDQLTTANIVFSF